MTEASILWPLLHRLQERARRLETEAVALRAEVEQVAQALDQPVATFMVDGEAVIVTTGDVEAVRSRLVKPRSEATLHELALLDKLRTRDRAASVTTRDQRFWSNLAAIRTQAIADSRVIDDPIEAIADD